MATLEKRGGKFRVIFRFGGQRFARSLKTDSERAATASLARLEDNLRRAELGVLPIPADVDVAAFLLSDGQAKSKVVAVRTLTLKGLMDEYFDTMPAGSLEFETIQGMRIHERQLKARLGAHFAIQSLSQHDLQRYIDARAKDPGRYGRKVTATTIKKAVVTLRTIWNWGVQRGLVTGRFPSKGLRYPKGVEKRPYMTFEEIARITKSLSVADAAPFWECLYLTKPDISALLDHVKDTAQQPFIYPLFVFAAHTGARRAELLRSKVTDIDFTGNMVTIHERKRAHDKITTRRVPLSPLLSSVLKDWLAVHPGGEHTFCQQALVVRSKRKQQAGRQLTRDEMHDHFKRPLQNSKWSKLRGWHVLRHSFISCLASAGIDQRFIDDFVGHQTDEQRRRYRHLLPDQQQKAIISVFHL